MIYFFEFLKGASLALLCFGAFYATNLNFELRSLLIGALPGFILLIFSYLLAQNYELKEQINLKDKL